MSSISLIKLVCRKWIPIVWRNITQRVSFFGKSVYLPMDYEVPRVTPKRVSVSSCNFTILAAYIYTWVTFLVLYIASRLYFVYEVLLCYEYYYICWFFYEFKGYFVSLLIHFKSILEFDVKFQRLKIVIRLISICE